MLRSAVSRSSTFLNHLNTRGVIFSIPTVQVVTGSLTRSDRCFSTTPLCSVVTHSASDVGGQTEHDRSTSAEPPVDKWNIDPETGKRRVGTNWNYSAELSVLAYRVGVASPHLSALKVALRDRSLHRRSSSSPQPQPEDNGRLSVLGRSLLQHYVQDYLYFNYPNLEGAMLKDVANYLNSEAVLLELSGHLGVTQLIQTRRLLGDPSNSQVITNAFAAVLGVLYEKQGAKIARSFVHDFVVAQLASKDLRDLVKLQHPRFMLYAVLKSKGWPRPLSRLISESGRATHFPSFVVGVYSGERQLGEGCGTSIKRAEKEAMLAALQTHFQTELSNCPLPSDYDDFIPEEQLQLNSDSDQTIIEDTPPQRN